MRSTASSAKGGIYRDMPLYNFADNHDVDRVASRLNEPGASLPALLPAVHHAGRASIYYGSEWGLKARARPSRLRPAPQPGPGRDAARPSPPAPGGQISRLAELRKSLPALRYGDYRQLHVAA